MATLLMFWVLLGVALPGFLAFYATRHRIRWLMAALLAVCTIAVAVSVWKMTDSAPATLGNLVVAQGVSAEVSRVIQVVMLIYAAAGTSLGVLIGWLAGRTMRADTQVS